MHSSNTVASMQNHAPAVVEAPANTASSSQRLYLFLLCISVGLWLLPIANPFVLDETFSYWQADGGLLQLWPRTLGWPCSALYPAFLWIARAIGGNSEIVLRLPSVLAMLAAVYLIFRLAEKLFDRETAFVAAILFSTHADVVAEAAQARAYGFALFFVALSALLLVRWVESYTIRDGIFFGAACAGIVYFHFLYAALLPAFALFLLVARRGKKSSPIPVVAAIFAFAVALLPLLPIVRSLMGDPSQHTYSDPPPVGVIYSALSPRSISGFVLWTLSIAVVTGRVARSNSQKRWNVLLPLSMAVVPVLLLFAMSKWTTMPVFINRYVLACVPGLAICWALPLRSVDSPLLRKLCCGGLVALTAITASQDLRFPPYSWKYALKVAEKITAEDKAPVLMCSDHIESNYHPMSDLPATENPYLSPVSYYRLHAPIIALPRELNDDAKARVTRFLATGPRRRFLAMAFRPSYPTLDWIIRQSGAEFEAHQVGLYDGVAVVEFVPR